MEDVLNILKQNFPLNDENFQIITKKTVKILVPPDYTYTRQQLIDKIKTHTGFTLEYKGASSLGRLRYNDLIIYVKPSHLQNGKSHGKENEDIFLSKINNEINANGCVDILLSSFNRDLYYDNIIKVENSSANGAHKYEKSDVRIFNKVNDLINFSLKKDGTFRWESSKTRYKSLFDKFFTKALNLEINNLILKPISGFEYKYKMLNPSNNKFYSKVIIDDFPQNNINEIVFGNETPSPVIVSRSFSEKDFITYDNLLKINCSQLFLTMEEIEKHNLNPVMVFMHHMNKKYGIDFRALPKYQSIYGSRANVLHVNFNEIG